VDEQLAARKLDQLRAAGELLDHPARPRQREPRIVGAPEQQHRRRDPRVDRGHVVERAPVELADERELARRRARIPQQRLDEQRAELAVEEVEIAEAAAEPQGRAAQPSRPQDQRQEPPAAGELREPHEPREHRRAVGRDLGVAEDEPGAPRAELGRGEPRDRAAAVVGDERHARQPERVDRAEHRGGVRGQRDRRLGGPLAPAGAGEIEHVAGEVRREPRDDRAPGLAVQRPAVDEHHVGAGAEPAVRDAGPADVELCDSGDFVAHAPDVAAFRAAPPLPRR
jgi:hypothetical protein